MKWKKFKLELLANKNDIFWYFCLPKMVIFLYFLLFIFQNSWLFFLYLIARFYHFEHFDLCINLLITDFKEKLCIKKRKVIVQQRKFLFEIIVVSWMSNKNCYHGEQHVKKMDNWHILNNSRKNSNFSARFYPQKFSSFWTWILLSLTEWIAKGT